jgi:hypothetical protein
MTTLSRALSAIAVLASLAGVPAAAQQPAAHAFNPNMSLSAPTNGPLQAQMRENYATSLRAAQHDLLRQNPSGLTRDELTIGHELNGYTRPQ